MHKNPAGRRARTPPNYDRIKRAVDVLIASLGLIALFPVMILTAGAVRLLLGKPVLFRQTRPGRDAKPFELIKFRSMADRFSAGGTPAPDGERLTPFGRFLRVSSLDELPQLYNVLKGDMSVVGPRPLLMSYLPLFTAEQARRHEVRPGLTGWAQANGATTSIGHGDCALTYGMSTIAPCGSMSTSS